MNTQWFLGANTAKGFVSHFAQLQSDPRVKELMILKGGPGCGKSTLMKKLRKTAHQLGADTESYLCSSDPQSLDGLLIVPIGFAIVDGTAPHVLEPQLCCCDGSYLNLGCFYDADGVKADRNRLEVLKKENQALYPAAYAHLAAAAELRNCARASMKKADSAGLYALMRTLVQEPVPSKAGMGRNREVFLHAYTPQGVVQLSESIGAVCHTQIALLDPFHMSAPLLERLREQYLYQHYDVISVLDPLQPERLEALLIPEIGMAYVSGEAPPANCAVSVRLSAYFSPSEATRSLQAAADAHIQNALSQLKEAKAIHDALELGYRPHVSFEGLDLLTQEYQKKIKAKLLTI